MIHSRAPPPIQAIINAVGKSGVRISPGKASAGVSDFSAAEASLASSVAPLALTSGRDQPLEITAGPTIQLPMLHREVSPGGKKTLATTSSHNP